MSPIGLMVKNHILVYGSNFSFNMVDIQYNVLIGVDMVRC